MTFDEICKKYCVTAETSIKRGLKVTNPDENGDIFLKLVIKKVFKHYIKL